MKKAQYIGYIYKTTNLINKKIYIGKRQKPVFDIHYIGSGKKLKSAIKHYGKENFKCELIQWCKTIEELNVAEKYWITMFRSRDSEIGYNISFGGEGGDVFHSLSADKQERFKEKLRRTSGSGTRGKFRVYFQNEGKTIKVKYILPDDLDYYEKAGWKRGLEPELAKKQGNIRAGKTQSKEWIEKRCKTIKNKTGKERELLHKHHSEATKKQMAKLSKEEKSLLGKKARAASLAKIQGKAIWIHKDGVKKLISECRYKDWELSGWKRGMK